MERKHDVEQLSSADHESTRREREAQGRLLDKKSALSLSLIHI